MICPNCERLLALVGDRFAYCKACDEHYDLDDLDLDGDDDEDAERYGNKVYFDLDDDS